MTWTQEIPTAPGNYWFISFAQLNMDHELNFSEPNPAILKVQRWGDCVHVTQLYQKDENTLVTVKYYSDGVLHYDLLCEGWYCPVEPPPVLPDEVLKAFRED